MSGGSIATAILAGGAGQAAGSLVGPATDATRGVYYSLKSKYDYIKNLNQNLEVLENEADYLFSREKDVNDKISKNQVIMEKTNECSTWLNDVGKIRTKVEALKSRYQKTIVGSCGPCLLCTRLKLSKEIVKLTDLVKFHCSRMNIDSILLRERHPYKVEKKFPKRSNDVQSLHENVEKLIELLKDESIKRIGLWGMSGVGKSTILQNLNDLMEKHCMFDIVIWITVSKEVSIRQMQQTILKRLGFTVDGTETESQAVDWITRSLENKKYLLLLDEVYSEFDLRCIGVHESQIQSKVVLATREKTVCNWMETDEEIKVEKMSKNDAWKLFRDFAGRVVDRPNIKPIAKRVLKQCGELPLVIRAVGNHLKGQTSEDFWRNTLSKLQSPNMYQLKNMEDMFNSFKIVFEELHHTLKYCLLYGASFPEEHEIYRDYLIECWKADQLIGVGETFKKTREEGHTNLDILIDRCLLDKCKSSRYVKMPIIFRNTALRMAHEQNFQLLMRDGEELEPHPSKGDQWANAKVISLINSGLEKLPERPESYMVSLLFLQKNQKLSEIPPSFFDCMSILKILDLCGTCIDFLPSSVSYLTSLRGFYLNGCHKLVCLPDEIAELKQLELLDISGSGIFGLPSVIGELTSLQCLRASFTNSLGSQTHVQANGIDNCSSRIINQLLQLEELTIDVDPKELKWNQIAPEITADLAKLKNLSTLCFYFPCSSSLEAFTQTSLSWKNGNGRNFRAFNICVGPQRADNLRKLDVSKCSSRRFLHYSGGHDTSEVMKEVLGRACAFELIDHQSVTNLSEFGLRDMECLEVCLVKGCKSMTTIVGSMPETTPFPYLRELHLVELPQFKEVCQGPIQLGSFAQLTILTLYNCPSVTEVVSSAIAEQLCELLLLRVESCSQVEQIIAADNQSSTVTGFPKLKTLELVKLENLISIDSHNSFELRDLQELEILDCPKLANLCLSQHNAIKMRSIRCMEAWWESLILNDEVRAHLQDLCCFL